MTTMTIAFGSFKATFLKDETGRYIYQNSAGDCASALLRGLMDEVDQLSETVAWRELKSLRSDGGAELLAWLDEIVERATKLRTRVRKLRADLSSERN